MCDGNSECGLAGTPTVQLGLRVGIGDGDSFSPAASDKTLSHQPIRQLMRPWWLLPLGRLNPIWWLGIGGVLLWADYLTGPKTEFPVLYFIPVALAAWYSGPWPAVALAAAMPLIHGAFLFVIWNESASTGSLVMMVLRAGIVMAIALWFSRLSAHERELRQHVQRLEGLLPICSFCKQIRNESGEWERLEAFIAERSEAQFSHAFCPSCWKTHYAELGEPPAE
jgi:hypothetical protein